MSLLRRNRWFAAAAGITLAFACVSLAAHNSRGLTVFADVVGFGLMAGAAGIAVANACTRPGKQRSFWALTALGLSLWASNQAAWCAWEVVLNRRLPDPFFFDIVLFFHTVPLTAAVAWRPDLLGKPGKVLTSLLHFLMLLGWWIFLYAFIVFPHQYVVLNVETYDRFYEALYGVQNAVLVAILALAAWTSRNDWRKLYLHLLGAFALYTVNAQLLDRAIGSGTYYSGSIYDVGLLATVAWVSAAALTAREWDLKSVKFNLDSRWKKLVPQMAMLAILSLPILGLWTVFWDRSPAPSRAFRIFAVLAAMLLLGTFVFFRQYLQDQALVSLLEESRRAYATQIQIQDQLVQKEKLASLGNLIAGAARDINYPLTAIVSHSEQLWANDKLSSEQSALVRKIVNQARRTADLILNLLSFAQQSPGEKSSADLPMLLSRAIQMLESRRRPGKVHLHLSVDADLPPILGNVNQLFQVFVEIVENAMDALDEVGGGFLEITARREQAEVTLQFSDTGPGLRNPERVFDPFYTTKPVGKGTGLGLSAVYGVIQDHGGQITCCNRPQGGAQFTIRLPLAGLAARVAGASGN